jgi:Tfp pilus assembly protein PilF
LRASDPRTAAAELQQALQIDPAARAAQLLKQALASGTPLRVNSVSRP